MASSSGAVKRGRGRPKKDVAEGVERDPALGQLVPEAEMGEDAKQSEPEVSAGKESDKSVEDKAKGKDTKKVSKQAKESKQERDKQELRKEERKDKNKEEKPKGDYVWPPDPDAPRMTAAGAICDAQARLQLSAYTDLRKWFDSEPGENKHPDSGHPGLRKEELPGAAQAVSLEGLSWWSDDKGAGWKTMRKAVAGKRKSESRWFGAHSWGSWRMAFLLARLQHQVWKAAEAEPEVVQEVPVPTEKVLSGTEEWHIFSPKTVDPTKCLARTWNNGLGGQCDEPRPKDNLLCYKHQRLAVSKLGLINGLADGPIPEKRLQQFREAAVKGLGGRKFADPKPQGDGGERRKRRKEESRAERKAHKARKRRRRRMEKGATEAATDAAGTLPPQSIAKEKPSSRKGGRKGAKGRPKKSAKTTSVPELRQDVRSRRVAQTQAEQQRRKQSSNKWTSVDDAMDQALTQIDMEAQSGPLSDLVDAQGCIPATGMAKAIETMKSTSLEYRLQFTMALRKTMNQNPQSKMIFMHEGGVLGLRQWLKEALPSPEHPTSRQHEEVVLESLGLLHDVPVTLEVLQSTGIGSTLMAIRNYVAPAMADAGELVAKWMKQFAKELKKTKAPPPSVSRPVRPVVQPPPLPPQPPAPPFWGSRAPEPGEKRPNFATRMMWRKRERLRNAQNEVEATLRELFRLEQVLEEDAPKIINLCHMDIDA